MRTLSPVRFVPPLLVVIALAITWLKPFYGTGIGLALALLVQIGLPGYLLARLLPVNVDHPLVRFVWFLACGLGLTIVLGGILRYLNLPIPVYLLALHALLLALALVKPPPETPIVERWRLKRASIPLYALLALACFALGWAGFQRSRVHFDMEVPTLYTAQVNWMAAEADHFAALNRAIGRSAELDLRDRARFDGWTYIQAAWVWASGIPAAELLWHVVTPLFVWMLPLIYFATAYLLTRRESAGAWSAAAVTIFALTTLDALVFPGNENSLYFGAQAVYLDTVRGASTILVVPLAMFALLGYLAQPSRRGIVPLLLLGHALALMRVRQIFILEVVALGTLAAWWLAAPSRRLRAALLLLVVLASFALLPFQMYIQPSLQGEIYASTITDTTLDTGSITTEASDRVPVLEGLYFRVLRGLPLLGDSFIIDSQSWFYSPLIAVGMALGLAAAWRWKRSFAAQFLFGTTAAITLLVFLPGLTQLYTRIFGSVAAVLLIAGLNFVVPVGLALGVVLGWLLDRLRPTAYVNAAAALVIGAGIFLTLFEPVSLLPASARDQIEAMNSAQLGRDIMPFDQQLLADFPQVIDPALTTRVLTIERTSGFLIEAFPNVFVSSWISPAGVVAAAHDFLDSASPFIAAADLQLIRDQAITHVIVAADSAVVPQLLLDPQRYQLLLASSGFLIFAVTDSPQVAAEADALFSQMNDLLATLDLPRWQAGAFALARSADAAPWEPLAAAWRDQLARQPSDVARYGLAMTSLLMNRDDEALPLWETLYRDHPDIPLFADALAYTRQQRGGDASSALLRNLDASQAYLRVLAARTLLTETFFYTLDTAQIDRVLAVAHDDALTWSQLAEWNRPDDVRRRAALALSARRFAAADEWLARIIPIELRPSDLVARAAIHLLRGDTDGALALLQPATDADWVAIRHYLHPDRWEPSANSAAQVYEQVRAGDPASLLALTQADAGMVMQPRVEAVGGQLTVSASFGAFVPAYAPQTWRVLVVSPDAADRYGSAESPAQAGAGELLRAALTVDLPPDLPPLTPARVIVQSLYSNTVIYDTRTLEVLLNRPPSAPIPAAAVASAFRFGAHITLDAYQAALEDGELNLALYWQTDAALNPDYQVFVHVVSAQGAAVAQQDAAPAENRYPTSAWLAHTVIEDRHRLPLDLPPGEYRVYVGLYRLADLTRLPVTPASEIVANDALRVFTFTVN